jgi:hypothetical protein
MSRAGAAIGSECATSAASSAGPERPSARDVSRGRACRAGRARRRSAASSASRAVGNGTWGSFRAGIGPERPSARDVSRGRACRAGRARSLSAASSPSHAVGNGTLGGIPPASAPNARARDVSRGRACRAGRARRRSAASSGRAQLATVLWAAFRRHRPRTLERAMSVAAARVEPAEHRAGPLHHRRRTRLATVLGAAFGPASAPNARARDVSRGRACRAGRARSGSAASPASGRGPRLRSAEAAGAAARRARW